MLKKKQSKNEWIGDIPIKWNEKPIRYVFNEIKEKNKLGLVTKALKFTYGKIISKTDFDADEDNYVANTILTYNIVSPGTIMINCLNLNYDFVSQRIGLVKDNGVITSAYLPIKPINDNVIDSEYANYQLKAWDNVKAFHNMGSGVRKTLDFNELGKKYILLPPIEMQKRIVSYLNLKCAEIDALHTDIEKQIETLEEYKKSIITEAVTKGLDPDVEMKDSGIEWVGMIPKNWNVTKFKYICSVKTNLVNVKKYQEYPQISPDNVEKDSGILLNYSTVAEAGVISDNHLFFKGQILYSKIRPKLNKATIAPFNGLCSADMYPIETNENTMFVLYMILSQYFLNQVSLVTEDRVKMPKINQEELGVIKIVLPDNINEQEKIVLYLHQKCQDISKAIEEKKEQLETLEQYKKSVIYEYVTGKKEVQ